jgi:hypothetical protein
MEREKCSALDASLKTPPMPDSATNAAVNLK